MRRRLQWLYRVPEQSGPRHAIQEPEQDAVPPAVPDVRVYPRTVDDRPLNLWVAACCRPSVICFAFSYWLQFFSGLVP